MKEFILSDGVTWTMFGAYFILGIFGLLCSVLFDVYSSGIDSKSFDLKWFLKDNKIRLWLSILAVIVGVLFSEQLLGSTLNSWTAFLSGFMSDKIIENMMARRKKKINSEDYNE